jgi:transposase
MEVNAVAIDIAKKVFQLPETGCIERLKLKRAQVLQWFVNRQPSLVSGCVGAIYGKLTAIGVDERTKGLPQFV